MDIMTRQALEAMTKGWESFGCGGTDGAETFRKDAAQGAAVGNTIMGSFLAIEYHAPRWAAEQAVVQALALIEQTPVGTSDDKKHCA